MTQPSQTNSPNPDALPTPDDHPSLQGKVYELDNADQREKVFNLAMDYRGDISLKLRDGRDVVGYLFDSHPDVAEPYLRLIPSDNPQRVKIAFDDVIALAFTGRDTAAGKSWETWVKQYHEKKARGETISREPEKLD